MNFLRNLCLLCLSHDYKLTSQCNLCPSITEIFGFIIPEYTFHQPEFPSQICGNCLESLKNIYNFRQRCLESIKTYNEYVQKLKQENESCGYSSVGITDIVNNTKCETFKNIQEVENTESEPNLDERMESEISGTHDCNSKTENYEKMVGKFEMVEFRVKAEIDEEMMIKENSDIFEHAISNNSEVHNMKHEKGEDEYIPSDDRKCQIFEDTHKIEKIKLEPNCDQEMNDEISETDYCNNSITEKDDKLSPQEIVESHVIEKINEQIIIKEGLKGDSNLSKSGILNNPEIHKMNVGEKEDGYISSNDSNEFVCERNTSVKFLKSEKGKPKLCFNGNLFYKDRQNEAKSHWKCQNYRKTKCAARVTTVGNTIVRTWKEHNHSGDAAGVEAAHLLDTIRTHAEATNSTPHSIITNVSRTYSQAVTPKLPNVNTIKRTIRNIRNRKYLAHTILYQ